MSERETGPIYNVPLIESLPLGVGGWCQAMPNRKDLEFVGRMSQRIAAGYEVLLSHYLEAMEQITRRDEQIAWLYARVSMTAEDIRYAAERGWPTMEVKK